MARASSWKHGSSILGLAVVVLGACATDGEWRTGSPTTLSGASFGKGCALGVPGARLDVASTKDGVALVFFTAQPPDNLRIRVRHAAAMHGRAAHRGPGHDGMHAQGGRHGLVAMQLPAARTVDVADVAGGARIELVPANPADRELLIVRANVGAERVNIAYCP